MAKKRKERRYLTNLVKGLPNTEEVHQMVKSINKLMRKSESRYKIRIVYRGPTYAHGETRRKDATSISLYLAGRRGATRAREFVAGIGLHHDDPNWAKGSSDTFTGNNAAWGVKRQLMEDVRSKFRERLWG